MAPRNGNADGSSGADQVATPPSPSADPTDPTSAAELTRRRREITARRRQLSRTELDAAAGAITARVLEGSILDAARAVALTFSEGGEVDTTALGRIARKRGVITCYPVIDDQAMHFVPWDGVRPTTVGPFGLAQPPDERPVLAGELDVVFVPLVLFGPDGCRAGRGGGYFDRAFSFLSSEPRPARPCLVGLAHDFQEDPTLVPQDWDIALDVIVTPTRLLRFR